MFTDVEGDFGDQWTTGEYRNFLAEFCHAVGVVGLTCYGLAALFGVME